MISLAIKELADRLAVANALVKNGYTVWFESRKDGKVSKQYVCAEVRKKAEAAEYGREIETNPGCYVRRSNDVV